MIAYVAIVEHEEATLRNRFLEMLMHLEVVGKK